MMHHPGLGPPGSQSKQFNFYLYNYYTCALSIMNDECTIWGVWWRSSGETNELLCLYSCSVVSTVTQTWSIHQRRLIEFRFAIVVLWACDDGQRFDLFQGHVSRLCKLTTLWPVRFMGVFVCFDLLRFLFHVGVQMTYDLCCFDPLGAQGEGERVGRPEDEAQGVHGRTGDPANQSQSLWRLKWGQWTQTLLCLSSMILNAVTWAIMSLLLK